MIKLEMGQYDAPQTQSKPIFKLDYINNNTLVFGGPSSGKTIFVKTFLTRLHDRDEILRERVYIIDFGGKIGDYKKLPYVCAYVDNRNEENIRRVIKIVEQELEKNSELLGSKLFSERLAKDANKGPHHITLIVENANSFFSDDRYLPYQDTLIHFCRDGISNGLSLLITANDTAGLGRIMPFFVQKVSFEMPADKYFDIFNAKVMKPIKLPGRGLINLDNSIYEFQCFYPSEYESSMLKTLTGEQEKKGSNKFIESMPNDLREADFKRLTGEEKIDALTIGIDYYDYTSVGININECRCIGIYGKKTYDKFILVGQLLNGIRSTWANPKFVFLDDGRKEFEEIAKSLNGGKDLKNEESQVVKYFTDFKAFKDRPAPANEGKDISYEVYILHSRILYTEIAKDFMKSIPYRLANANAEKKQSLYIFTDVRFFTAIDINLSFNSCISAAILLENIAEFVVDRGKSSVFKDMDVRELKANYARCINGDGFIYIPDSDTLKKVKFLTRG